MIDVGWRIEEEHRDTELTGSPRPLLSTWHFLRSALRREWRTWVGLAGLGAVLGMTAAVLLPPTGTSTVTLLMAHPATVDGPSAMATDVTLLNTREVAEATLRKLGLDLSPDAFQSTVKAVPVTTQVLTITVSGPDDSSALARVDALVTEYLAFRATQLRYQTSGLITGYQTRIAAIKEQVNALNEQYNALSRQGLAGQSQAFEILAQRTELNSQITAMQQAIEESTLQTDAAIASTHVIDFPRVVRREAKKAIVLDVGSGLIAGAAVGVAFVLFRALTSDRVRRRNDVALALGAPVRFSVASRGPAERRLERLRQRLWARRSWRVRDLDALVYGLESAIVSGIRVPGSAKGELTKDVSGAAPFAGATSSQRDEGGASAAHQTAQGLAGAQSGDCSETDDATRGLGVNRSATDKPWHVELQLRRRSGATKRVAVAAMGNARAAAAVIGGLATHLRGLGMSVFLVDLSVSGALDTQVSRAGDLGDRAESTKPAQAVDFEGDHRSSAVVSVFRPTSVPGLARSPDEDARAGGEDVPVGHVRRVTWESADVVLALVEVDPGFDSENLGSWVDQVVPLVTAGRSTAELLETTAQLIRAAGLTLPFAMMVGSDDSDESLGLMDPSQAEPAAATSQM